MPRPYCVKCQCEMLPERNGVTLEIYGALWQADLWQCPSCGTEIIAGYGFKPFDEQWRPTYQDHLKQVESDGLYRAREVSA